MNKQESNTAFAKVITNIAERTGKLTIGVVIDGEDDPHQKNFCSTIFTSMPDGHMPYMADYLCSLVVGLVGHIPHFRNDELEVAMRSIEKIARRVVDLEKVETAEEIHTHDRSEESDRRHVGGGAEGSDPAGPARGDQGSEGRDDDRKDGKGGE